MSENPNNKYQYKEVKEVRIEDEHDENGNEVVHLIYEFLFYYYYIF